jgi:hypothetical protein
MVISGKQEQSFRSMTRPKMAVQISKKRKVRTDLSLVLEISVHIENTLLVKKLVTAVTCPVIRCTIFRS